MKDKRWIAILLVVCTLIGLPHMAEQVLATSAEDKKNQAQDDLDDVNSEIDDIKDSQEVIKDQIAATRKKLNKLLSQQEELGEVIISTQAIIEQTELELEAAQKDADEQYEAMKLRIQYMYENSTEDSIWNALIEADGLTDLLNRIEYIAQVHKADRDMTEQYKATVDTVQAKKEDLLLQMESLLEQEQAYLAQQTEIEDAIAELKDNQEEFAEALATAQQKATNLKAVIAEQERIIEEERKRREEEERRRQEEEKKKQEEAAKNNVKGTDIVNFARKYVGNPYVWGGNSLTNGCDCSGFVHLVYKNFGISTPRYSMSFLNVGEKVSLDEIQPGDIVIYNKKNGIGHVAIYIGNGKIVEAQSSEKGITDDRDVDCRSIAGIRRIVKN